MINITVKYNLNEGDIEERYSKDYIIPENCIMLIENMNYCDIINANEVKFMLLFSGGLTEKQMKILLNDEDIIFDKIPYDRAGCKSNNTFDYIPRSMENIPIDDFRKYVADDCYKNQYIFLAKYLIGAMEFCKNRTMQNYILVCEIDSQTIEPYIGVGDYKDGDYRIEYRLPRRLIKKSNIIEFLYYEPYDDEQIKEFKEKYANDFYVPSLERESAHNLIKQKKLIFNRDKFK